MEEITFGQDIRTVSQLHQALRWIGLNVHVSKECPNHPGTFMVIEHIDLGPMHYHIDWVCTKCMATEFDLERDISYLIKEWPE